MFDPLYIIAGDPSWNCVGELLPTLLLSSSMGRKQAQWFRARAWGMVCTDRFQPKLIMHKKKLSLWRVNSTLSVLFISGASTITWPWSRWPNTSQTILGAGTAIRQSCKSQPWMTGRTLLVPNKLGISWLFSVPKVCKCAFYCNLR